ncbi:MAG: endonuclease/exonuclease/phosphatase family protein [Gammaproteobacteria bacterium]|nr:endonuclease/exonuclease/phosphatase family protein [Gammaproteobacteria bacterium]
MKRIVLFVVVVFAAITAISTALGFAGDLYWVFDLFSNFRMQYFAAAFVAGIALFLLDRRVLSFLCAFVALANLGVIVPLYPVAPDGEQDVEEASIVKLLVLNLDVQNRQTARLLELIDKHSPDTLVFLEFNERWQAELSTVSTSYPHHLEYARQDNFGMAMFSRKAFDGKIVQNLGGPALEATFANYKIFAAHPPPPITESWAMLRDVHAQSLGLLLGEQQGAALLVGDFNATPWSTAYRALMRDSGLADCGRSSGIQPSWPTGLWPLYIPIDHCFHNSKVTYVKKTLGPKIGSDHLPIFVEFAVATE